MDEGISVSVTVEKLRAAGTDPSKQVPALLKLGEWYLKKATSTANGADFTKANALYNAALVRSRSVNHEIGEDQILRRIIVTYREFLYAFAKHDHDDGTSGLSADEIGNEIDSHKEFLAKERQIFQKHVNDIDSCFYTNDKTEDQYEIHAEKTYEVFRDIQDMYIRLVSMLAKECESRLGKPPCDYAIIALGSVARMEATPFSDLEFAILYSDPAIEDKISYFQLLSHFLHLKVINLGETILPALGIEQLNDFQSSDPNGNWFYDSETPRGISFDGAMPWASKTPLGRMATKNKPALELIKTPEQMAQLQDEEIAVKEGYHLADIMSRAALLYGEQALLEEYNERVAKKLNTKSSVTEGKSTKTIGFNRGMQQMVLDVTTYNPYFSYLGQHCTVGALFDAKKEFHRLISLLLSDLGLIFDIRSPSPWEVISELQTRRIIGDSESANIKVCLSIANGLRLKTYFANNGQKELFSPVPQYANTMEQSADAPILRDFHEDIVVRLLSTSNDMHRWCQEFQLKYIQQDEIDTSIFRNPSLQSSKATLIGTLYFRLQNFPKALEWMKSESKDNLDYSTSLNGQGVIYNHYKEYEKSVKFFEHALEVHYQNENTSNLNVLTCIYNMVVTLKNMGQYGKAIPKLQEAIGKHNEIYGRAETIHLSQLMQNLGAIMHELGYMRSAIETYQKVEQMQNRLTGVPDMDVIQLNLLIATSLSELDQHAQSLEYVKRALHLSHKLFGEHNLSSELAQIYVNAGAVYERCNLNDEALSWYKRSLELFQLVFGDNPHPDKIQVLNKLGMFFFRRCQIDKAVENLESALEQARTISCGKRHFILAQILNYLGAALTRAQNSGSEKSLRYFQEARKIMDEILGPNHAHSLTSSILNNMGTVYHDLGELAKALQCYKDALNMNSEFYEENGVNDAMATVRSNLACVEEMMGIFSQAKEHYSKAVKIDRKNTLTKNTCPGVVTNLYSLSLFSQALGEQNEALKHLEEAREVIKVAGIKHCIAIKVLVELTMKYFDMRSVAKYMMCYLEAREIAECLPEDDSFPPEVLEVLKLLKK